MNQLFASGSQNIGASASASVLQGGCSLALTVGSPFCSRESQESSPAPQLKSINSLALSLLYGPPVTSIHDPWKNHSSDYMDLCQQSDVSAF